MNTTETTPIKLTYNKTITLPRLSIKFDEDAFSPREWDGNIGYFFTRDKRYRSPDGNKHPLYDIMINTIDEANEEGYTSNYHIYLMKRDAKELYLNSKNEDYNVIDIFPIVKYEHGKVSYSIGTQQGWDYSNNGFYFVTKQKLNDTGIDITDIEKVIDNELEIYTKWANGETYCFSLYNENGEFEQCCGGYYEIEDIRSELPEEFKNEDLEKFFNY